MVPSIQLHHRPRLLCTFHGFFEYHNDLQNQCLHYPSLPKRPLHYHKTFYLDHPRPIASYFKYMYYIYIHFNLVLISDWLAWKLSWVQILFPWGFWVSNLFSLMRSSHTLLIIFDFMMKYKLVKIDFRCDICDRKFPDVISLERHKNYWKCFCGQVFSTETRIALHVKENKGHFIIGFFPKCLI